LGKGNAGLLLRVASSLVLLPIVLVLLWQGGWWFLCLILVLTSIAAFEYVSLLRRLDYAPSYLFAAVLLWAVLLTFHLSDATAYLQPVLAGVLLVSLAWHVLRDRTPTPIQNWLLPLAGALYIGWCAGHMFSLRALPGGAYRLFTVFGITWLADTGSYFCGRTWGKRPMAPRISPGKTWEGFAGGVASATIGGTIISGLGGLGWGHGAVLGCLLSLFGPLGDLGISMIKRQVGVKDSGKLIPGHGGALDRMDSILLTVVVGYYYQVWVMGLG
jgi:phosphatidate cytidylyltransferase